MTFIHKSVELEVNSFIRGYHAYKDVWTPFIGEELLLRREPDNVKDRSAVAVLKDGWPHSSKYFCGSNLFSPERLQ